MQVTFQLDQCAFATELVAYKVSEHAPGMLCSTELCRGKTVCKVFLATGEYLEAAWWWPRCFRRNEKGFMPHFDDDE
jgi:hypothetical protein